MMVVKRYQNVPQISYTRVIHTKSGVIQAEDSNSEKNTEDGKIWGVFLGFKMGFKVKWGLKRNRCILKNSKIGCKNKQEIGLELVKAVPFKIR